MPKSIPTHSLSITTLSWSGPWMIHQSITKHYAHKHSQSYSQLGTIDLSLYNYWHVFGIKEPEKIFLRFRTSYYTHMHTHIHQSDKSNREENSLFKSRTTVSKY